MNITPGKRLCRAYYSARGLTESDEADAIYYGERDFWDHMAAAAIVAFVEQPAAADPATEAAS